MKKSKKLTFITRENVIKERPFGRPAQMIKRFEREGYSIKKIYRINKWNFIEKLNKIKNNEIIVACGSKAGVLSILAKISKNGIKVIHDWQDDYSRVQKNKGGLGRIFYPIYKNLEDFIVKSSDAVITISKSLQQRGKKNDVNCTYIPCGVDKKLFDKGSGKKIRGGYGKPMVLYIGGGGPFKNIDLLIKAVKNLDCYLMLVGFLFFKKTKKLASNADNVIFEEEKSQEEIPGYIDAADICCSTENWDGGLKIFEYLYMNKVILSVKGKPEYLLTHKKNAFLSDISVEGFRKSIKSLLEDKKLRKKLERGTKKIKVYDWEEIFNMYRKVVEGVMNK